MPVGPVRDAARQLGEVKEAVSVGVLLDEGDPPLRRPARAARRRTRRRPRWARSAARRRRRSSSRWLRSMPMTGVMPLPAVRNRTRSGRRVREDEVALGLVEHDHRAGLGAADEVVADLAVGDRLDRHGDQAVGGGGGAGQRVGAPLADAVDVDADADVLAGDMALPAAAGADHQGDGVGGLAPDVDDAASQVSAGTKGADQVEVVGGQEWCRHQLGRSQGPGDEGRSSRGCSWSTHVFYYPRRWR